jgi:hypothetical protein
MLIGRNSGNRRDIPLTAGLAVPAAAAGSAADYEKPIWICPDLTKLASTGQAGTLPLNAMQARLVLWAVEAALTGVVTNNFTWSVRQLRGGNPLVNTTSATAVASAGVATVTPASMANIALGTPLLVDAGAAQETVVPTAVTATTFTATFANTHSGTWAIVSAPLASVAYTSAGVTETAYVPRQIAALPGNTILPGDVLTFRRVSSNVTGLASPAVTVLLELDPVRNKLAIG